jgi:hypothetical protein
MAIQQHKDKEVQAAIVRLTDALCTWERETGRENILIIREVDGFEFRAINGKPNVPDDLDDAFILKRFQEGGS